MAKEHNEWPLPKFQFVVIIDGKDGAYFTEVSGLDIETQIIEYRHGNSQVFSAIKMPGLKKHGNITLKKGVLNRNSLFLSLFNQAKTNTVKRSTVVIKLLDEKGGAVMTWTLQNAFPTRITSPDVKADANEIAVETIEINHEGLTVSQG